MKKMVIMKALGAMVLVAVGIGLAGCKSAPDLSQAQALSLIQAKYDKTPPAPFAISVGDRGMQQGVHANYWLGTKRYPNGYWADFKLTPAGQKVIKLSTGGDTMQWRPDGPNDSRYSVVITTLANCGLKARSLGDIQGSDDSKTVSFTEDVALDNLPAPLQDIAHNPGNQISSSRTATFTLADGAWTLQSIR